RALQGSPGRAAGRAVPPRLREAALAAAAPARTRRLGTRRRRVTHVDGVEVRGPVEGRQQEILNADALAFVAELQRRFDGRRRELLEAREDRQRRIEAGERPDFLPETK